MFLYFNVNENVRVPLQIDVCTATVIPVNDLEHMQHTLWYKLINDCLFLLYSFYVQKWWYTWLLALEWHEM